MRTCPTMQPMPGIIEARTDRTFAAASSLRKRLGSHVVGGIRIPTGIAFGSIADHVATGLREHDWPVTKLSLRVAQLKDKAASERLWTEENA